MLPPKITLGIETSCDETAVAIVANGKSVLCSLVSSQIAVHEPFGGVVPEIAAREHLKALDPMVNEALKVTGLSIKDIDLIGVTQGPGLIGALLVGVAYSKALSLSSGCPLVPVNHVHAHVHGALLGVELPLEEIFPALAAVVSGGHTHLYFMADPTSYELLAYSIDDACGESFDKVAKIFNLGYPGGPAVEMTARSGDASAVSMPKMMNEKARMEFSYSGLKTHVVNLATREGRIHGQRLADVCAAFQKEALGQLVRKISYALEIRPEARTVLIAGGVAANAELRRLIADHIERPALLPHPRFCSDNAAMIAALAAREYQRHSASGATATAPWDAFSRYSRITKGSTSAKTS